MKSPRQVRSDIRTLTSHLGQVRDALLKKADERLYHSKNSKKE